MNTLLMIILGSHFLIITNSEKLDVVFGGYVARLGQFPYQVSIQTDWGAHHCGGSIYNHRWIITAAHCVRLNLGKNGYRVEVGMIDLNRGTKYKIIKEIAYPNPDVTTPPYDVALVKVDRDIVFNDHVRPIPLGETFVREGVSVILSGWGKTERGSTNALMYTTLHTISNHVCQRQLRRFGFVILPEHVCTYSGYNKGACYGDSGGPLVANGKLIGIVSFGVPCAEGFPDVFARVSSFKDWIKEKTR